ncbi:hypothetical protein MKW94_000521 [Papaver nudicaule]|uniref:DNA (cytosine-5-)-methyltransferase n=1 Tax=Papaver nudicaule TaxID=74823 RepID=A0AA41SN49_PAPNU|nr:hypothetical protein [Papaver nudicaule]
MVDNGESSINWTSEEEDDECHTSSYACTSLNTPCAGASSSNPTRSNTISHFTAMGFSEELVVKVIDENGEGSEDRILETLLSYKVIEESSPHLPDKDKKMLELVEMGFHIDEVSSAINTCDPDTSTAELMDHIYAARYAGPNSNQHNEQPLEISKVDGPNGRKKKFFEQEDQWEREIGSCGSNGMAEREKRIKLLLNADEGEAVTNIWKPTLSRKLPDLATGRPYFYLENSGFPSKNWSRNTSFLHNLEPEFVDSKSFCAVAKRSGYLHNLPKDNRSRLLPTLPLTIKEALPHTTEWWPWWDSRIQFESLHACNGSPKPTETIRKAFDSCQGEPPLYTQKNILDECRRCNLVWTGRNRVSILELEEMELLLGYPLFYTRGGGTRTERYKALGSSLQVDTVAYHLSVLKERFPSGISVLSIFPGIGGAEIALYRLGIPLKLVVTVENFEASRKMFRSWWEGTNQKGILIDNITNVNMLTSQKLEDLIGLHGGFDLIIGGRQCNDIKQSNQRTRDYHEGNNSSLFYEYSRILDKVRCLMGAN